MNSQAILLAGILVGFFGIPCLTLLLRFLHVEVEDGETVLVTRHGRHTGTLSQPGWYWLFDRLMPWVKIHRVSLRRDYREIPNVFIHDTKGTGIVLDVFVELRVVDPVKATFSVSDWPHLLDNLVAHAMIAALGNRSFEEILRFRAELSKLIEDEIRHETARWGIQIDLVMVRSVSVSPAIAGQLVGSVAAKLERAKAHIEEDGRQTVALLEANTSATIATLIAEARGEYPLAVGRAYEGLGKRPEVFQAYQTLYELSLLQPHRTVAFQGFAAGEVRAMDAAMAAGTTDAPSDVFSRSALPQSHSGER